MVKLILLLGMFHNWDIVYCSSYETREVSKTVSTTILVGTDSVRTYIEETGYIWWELVGSEREVYRTCGSTRILETGIFRVRSIFGHAIITITKEEINQYIYFSIKGEEFKFHIKLKRNDVYKGRC